MPIFVRAILIVVLALFILFIIPFTVYLAMTQTSFSNYAREKLPPIEIQ